MTESKPLFIRQRFLHLSLVVYGLLSFALMLAGPDATLVVFVRHAVGVVVYPLIQIEQLPFRLYRGMAEAFTDREELRARLQQLEQDNLILAVRAQKFAALSAENMRLRELLRSSFKLGERLLVAELLPVTLEAAAQKVLLNKGAADEVYLGQPFVDAFGIMGQVVSVSANTSVGLLITDVAHALPVETTRSGVRAVAVGTGLGNRLELNYVPNNADLAKGDLLVSSGMGGRFPAGYPVGEVVSVELDAVSPFARVIALPTAKLLRSREVLLLWPEFPDPPSVTNPVVSTPDTANAADPAP